MFEKRVESERERGRIWRRVRGVERRKSRRDMKTNRWRRVEKERMVENERRRRDSGRGGERTGRGGARNRLRVNV